MAAPSINHTYFRKTSTETIRQKPQSHSISRWFIEEENRSWRSQVIHTSDECKMYRDPIRFDPLMFFFFFSFRSLVHSVAMEIIRKVVEVGLYLDSFVSLYPGGLSRQHIRRLIFSRINYSLISYLNGPALFVRHSLFMNRCVCVCRMSHGFDL